MTWNVSPDRQAKGLYWERAWNLIEGCTPCGPECDSCWAARESHMRQSNPNAKIAHAHRGLTTDAGVFTGEVRVREDRLVLPTPKQKPMVWSVWTDLLHTDVPNVFIDKAFATICRCQQHTFLICTKRPERFANLIAPLPNVVLMTTAGNQKTFDARVPHLLKCEGWRLGLSCEPLLGAIQLCSQAVNALSWVTCGGESGAKARPSHPYWFQMLLDDCEAAGIPFHFKQWGEWMPVGDCRLSDAELSRLPVHRFPDGQVVYRVGKKAAGRLLDGKLHNSFPEVTDD